ncbi:MAG: DUF2239 family protein [Paracoccaceae bacterium]|nr:DUF2239 family protein [Maritimibacter sp.]
MTDTYTAFIGPTRLASGPKDSLIATLAARGGGAHPDGLLVFSDRTGAQVDLNLSGRTAEARPTGGFRPDGAPQRGRGRPKLGVKAREVTLLPRHWDWLATQRGGASAALRRLVEAEMRTTPPPAAAGRDAAYAFLTAIAGNLPGYEAAIRALYAEGGRDFAAAMAGWPEDIRAHALHLAGL